MKKGFKKVLAFSIIMSGLWYMAEYTDIESNSTSVKGININLNDKDKLVTNNNISESTELLLVNREFGLNKDYIPEGLKIPNIKFSDAAEKEEKHVAGIAIKPLEKLVKAAEEEGITLLGNSAYRSYKSQEKVYKERVKSEGKALADAYVAKPGFSEHQTGLCIDITNTGRYFVKGTIEADWIAENCYKFGFIIRYPEGKKSITGIEYEPWHIRYVGEKSAKYINDNGITLEEYLDKK